MTNEQIYSILRKNGYKITYQRKEIVDLLLKNIDTFLSCEDMQVMVQDYEMPMNLSTIYRNMEAFQACDLVHKYTTKAGIALYKLSCVDHHHHHITCMKCHKTTSIDYCPMEVFKKISNDNEYELVDHSIELFGICKDCNHSTE